MGDKFKEMTFAKKAEHIWEYYKIPIFSVIFAIIAGYIMLDMWVLNPTPATYCNIAFCSDSVTDNTKKQLLDELPVNEENSQLIIESYYSPDPEMAYDLGMKFQTIVMAGQLDIIIAENVHFKNMTNQGFIVPLEDVLSKEELEYYEKEGLLFNLDTEHTPGERAYGVNLKNTKTILKDSKKISDEGRYIGFVRTSKRYDNAKDIFFRMTK